MSLTPADLKQIENYLRGRFKVLGRLNTEQHLENWLRQRISLPPRLQGQITRSLEGLDALNADMTALTGRVASLEGLNAGTRLTALEGLNAGTRLTALEAINADGRLDDLEALNIGNRLDSLERDAHRVHVYRTTNRTITSGTSTFLEFGSERYDEPSNDQHDQTAGSNLRLTCTKTGKYLVYGAVEWEHSNAGSTQADIGYRRALFIERNGSQDLAKVEQSPIRDTTTELGQVVMTEIELTVNDYVRLGVFHDHPSADLDIVNTTYSPEFGMVRVGSTPA